MGVGRATRTIVCQWCGSETVVPSRRGPAPTYCSPAHRQAMFRARHRAPQRPQTAEGAGAAIHELWEALRAAAAEEHWARARQVLLDRLGEAVPWGPDAGRP